jgi:hypothetical protein
MYIVHLVLDGALRLLARRITLGFSLLSRTSIVVGQN